MLGNRELSGPQQSIWSGFDVIKAKQIVIGNYLVASVLGRMR